MSTFVPRLTSDGMLNNAWWYSNGNVYYAPSYIDPDTQQEIHPYALPNCTCYAYGRYGEIRGAFQPLLSYNPNTIPHYRDAKYWWEDTQGLQKGQVPQLGAVACYGTYDDQYGGHVSVVEEIDELNGSITISNSAFNGWYFQTETVYASNGYKQAFMTPNNRPYYLQGFIYVDGYVPPTPPSHRRKSKWWMYLRYYPW